MRARAWSAALRSSAPTKRRTCETRWSYVILVEELRRVVADARGDAHELFRRMCFNALISNIDDHPRNHALIAKEKDWRLSPAYDLTPSPVIAQEHRDLAMDCGDMGRFANARNILSQHARFLLEKDEAEKIVSEMKDQVAATWYDTVRACGVSRKGRRNNSRRVRLSGIFAVKSEPVRRRYLRLFRFPRPSTCRTSVFMRTSLRRRFSSALPVSKYSPRVARFAASSSASGHSPSE